MKGKRGKKGKKDAEVEEIEETEGKKKGKKGKILLLLVVLVAAAAAALLFFRKGEKEPPVIPQSYSVGGESIPALTTEVAPEISTMESLTGEEPAGESEKKQETDKEGESQEETAPPVTAYAYTMEGAREKARAYLEMLTGEEQGFQVVDSQLLHLQAPKEFETEGELYLGRTQMESEPERSIQIRLSWTESTCTVALACVPGRVHEESRQLSSMETMDYLRSLPPSQLGLPGETMEGYMIYTLDGGVLVDGEPCIPVNIYRRNEQTGTNEVVGCYYLSSGERRIYQKDLKTGQVEEIRGPGARQPGNSAKS